MSEPSAEAMARGEAIANTLSACHTHVKDWSWECCLSDLAKMIARALDEKAAALAEARESLRVALLHSVEYAEGCLHCGEGEIVEGATTSGHKAACWYYRAEALLARAPERLSR